jgi:hypothetical protein
MSRDKLVKDLEKANARSLKLSEARRALPPGSSRARVTTANARWARAAEERDRLLRELEAYDEQDADAQSQEQSIQNDGYWMEFHENNGLE